MPYMAKPNLSFTFQRLFDFGFILFYFLHTDTIRQTVQHSFLQVQIDVKDINDNAPEFDSSLYIAVVLENVVPQTSVLNVSAHDPDEGSAGLVHYKLIDEQQLQGTDFETEHIERWLNWREVEGVGGSST